MSKCDLLQGLETELTVSLGFKYTHRQVCTRTHTHTHLFVFFLSKSPVTMFVCLFFNIPLQISGQKLFLTQIILSKWNLS